MELKKLVFGKKSIVWNIEKIYNILWENLECEDSWILMQTIIRDMNGERFDLWLSKGLLKISDFSGELNSKIYGKDFNEVTFRKLFSTLCVLMEVYYKQIVEHLSEYFYKMTSTFFTHSNKYIRKFSV